MGGFGSGRWSSHSTKATVEQCLVVDVADLTPEIRLLLQGHSYGFESIRPLYSGRWRGDLKLGLRRGVRVPLVAYISLREHNAAETIFLQSTPCHFGGQRWWFSCRFCARRVRKLYLPPDSMTFKCRHCLDLTYRSCQESRTPRLPAYIARAYRAWQEQKGTTR